MRICVNIVTEKCTEVGGRRVCNGHCRWPGVLGVLHPCCRRGELHVRLGRLGGLVTCKDAQYSTICVQEMFQSVSGLDCRCLVQKNLSDPRLTG
jgi:hypothetical protein